MTKWDIGLIEFDFSYHPRPSTKAQELADFMIECIIPEDRLTSNKSEELNCGSIWILHLYGASNSQKSDADLILTNAEGIVIEYALRFTFEASNNQAEYEALIVGIKIAKELGVKRLKVFIDSQFVAGQTHGEYEA